MHDRCNFPTIKELFVTSLEIIRALSGNLLVQRNKLGALRSKIGAPNSNFVLQNRKLAPLRKIRTQLRSRAALRILGCHKPDRF